MKVGSSIVTVNGKTYTLDNPATVVGGNLLVSARLVSMALDTPLQWDSASRTLLLSTEKQGETMKVESEAFTPYGNIPAAYASPGVGGQNTSIPVLWSGAPAGTKSYAVVMYDANPIADQFVHYSVVDIPDSVKELKKGATDNLEAGKKVIGYYGMQSPRFSGDHQYRIKVFALDQETITLPENPVFFEDLEPVLKEHALAIGELDGFFKFE